MSSSDAGKSLLDAEAGGDGSIALKTHSLTFTASSVEWSDGGKSAGSFSFKDMLGCNVVEKPPAIVLTAYPRGRGSCSSKAARKPERVTLPCASVEQAQSATTAVRQALFAPDDLRATKKMLVLINPFGGGGKAPGVWRTVSGLIEHLGLKLEVVQTTHAGHAREMMGTLPLDEYAAVCPVSGDGLVIEIINGLLARPDGREAVARLPLAPVPGGTGNGLWRSLIHKAGESNDLLGAAFLLAKGSPQPLDAWEYVRPGVSEGGQAGEEHISWSMLSLAWGIIADIDLESEVLRCLGPLRMTIYGLWRVIALRRYEATLHYLDADTDEWRTVSASNLAGIWACNVPFMTETDMAAPAAQLDDGVMQLLILKATSRAKALGVFLAIEDGSHVTSSVVDVVRVKAFRLEPVPRTPSAPGLYSLDGEPVPFGAIEARPHPRMLRVLV